MYQIDRWVLGFHQTRLSQTARVLETVAGIDGGCWSECFSPSSLRMLAHTSTETDARNSRSESLARLKWSSTRAP